jgi:hypothetical protein
MGGLPLEFISTHYTAQKRGSVSRIHQPKEKSASRFHQPDGGLPLEFINIQLPKGGLPLEFINIQPKNGGPPIGTISMDLAVSKFLDFI